MKHWPVEPSQAAPAAAVQMEGGSVLFGTSRLGALAVDPLFDRQQFVVRKADGTVAFDYYNVFAAPPSSLLRASAQSGLQSNGHLGRIVGPSSAASVDAQVELRVKDLSLDCTEAGRRLASAAVSVDVVKMGRGPREIALTGEGRAAVDAQDGNYSRAFSQAFSKALDAAVSEALGTRR